MATVSKQLAVVTGASTGIGLEIARQLAQRGYDLVVAADEEQIEASAEQLRQTGVNVIAVRADLRTPEGCDAVRQAVSNLGRPMEIIALNAGIGVGGRFAETDLDKELDIIDLNVTSTVRLAKWAVTEMTARGRGRILITASIAGIMPTPMMVVYGASKAFVLSFSSSLHYELENTGVTVTAMLPGATDTEFFHRAGMDDTKVATEDAKKNNPADVARIGVEALLAGKERVAAGNFGVKLQEAMASFIPERTKAHMHEKMAAPGSAKKS